MKRKKDTNPLAMLAELAKFISEETFTDSTSPSQRRGFREAADSLRGAIEEYAGELSAPILMAFWSGAACEAHVAATTNPLSGVLAQALGQGGGGSPQPTVMIVCSYMARDLLAGERVE